MKRKVFFKGIKDGIPIALGYLAVSFTLGIAARKVGLGAFAATLMSFTNNTSAGEFAALSLIGAGSSYAEMALTQFVINARYMLMSCSLSQKIPKETPIWKRMLLGYCITDEVFGVSYAYPGKLDTLYSYGAMLLPAVGWSLGTFLGVVLGNVLPQRILSALGVALYGMFIAIIVPPAKKNKVIAGSVIVSMAMSWAFSVTPVLKNISSGFTIIIITLVVAGAAALIFPVEEEAADEA
ncbi:MAG: AzlC family ABC transporter permease [Clostridia bacterium]|nr:AzlC family ABC transporter permease [Clostridia bacterium]